MYYVYIRVAVQGAFPCHSSQYCAQSFTSYNLRIVAEPRSRQLMYYLYIRVAVSVALSCSEQKPSLPQRHRLQASNAESRIRLVVLLTAPKIFAISSITNKNSCRNFARLSAWWFDWAGHPHPKRKLIRSVLINGMCLFEVSVRKANAEISAEQDE